MLELRGLSKIFPDGTCAVSDVDLVVDHGALLVVLTGDVVLER